MASLQNLELKVSLVPNDETMKAILALLDLWQDANPDLMVAMVPQRDRYGYEIINRKPGPSGTSRGEKSHEP